MPKAKSHTPEGLRTVTPHLTVKNSLAAIEFYKKAFGAQVKSVAPGPAPGSTIHAEIRIGDSAIFLSDEMPQSKTKAPGAAGTTVAINLFVPDADSVFNKAVAAGAKSITPPADMFWGDRYGQLIDPFGHAWAIATHLEDLTPEETNRRATEFFKQFGAGAP